MMEDEDIRPATEAAVKQKIDKVARGWRKWWKEEDIRPDIHPQCHGEHGIQRDSILKLNEAQQEEDEWQTPDKWQKNFTDGVS